MLEIWFIGLANFYVDRYTYYDTLEAFWEAGALLDGYSDPTWRMDYVLQNDEECIFVHKGDLLQ